MNELQKYANEVATFIDEANETITNHFHAEAQLRVSLERFADNFSTFQENVMNQNSFLWDRLGAVRDENNVLREHNDFLGAQNAMLRETLETLKQDYDRYRYESTEFVRAQGSYVAEVQNELKDFAKEVQNQSPQFTEDMWKSLVDAVKRMAETIQKLVENVSETFMKVTSHIKETTNELKTAVKEAVNRGSDGENIRKSSKLMKGDYEKALIGMSEQRADQVKTFKTQVKEVKRTVIQERLEEIKMQQEMYSKMYAPTFEPAMLKEAEKNSQVKSLLEMAKTQGNARSNGDLER